jgi:hypothetical protein
MRPVRIIAAILFAAIVGMSTLLPTQASAAPVAVNVSPGSVTAGDTVTVAGSVGPDSAGSECASRVTLISTAFVHADEFAGLPAVSAAVQPSGAFTTTTRIPRATAAGTYPIIARCGGATLGSTTLVVQATGRPNGPSLVSLGRHRFGHLRAPDAIAAHADPDEVGFYSPPNGADGVSFGPWSFDVAKDGSIWLLDEVNHQLLVWQPGRPDHPARKVRLPLDPLERIADFAVAQDHTIYATYEPPPGPGPKTLRLCALSPSGQVRWTAPTIDAIFNAQLRIGPDGALYAVGALDQAGTHDYWTPLTSPAGRPLPLAEQRRRTSPQQPLPGGLRLSTAYVSAHEQHVTLTNQAGQPVRGWRITSQTGLGALGATPAVVTGDPVVVFGVSQQTTSKFLYEYEVLRLARGGTTSVRFAINPASRAVWGDAPVTGVRVGPDGQLYQLRTDRTSGVSIARYSLGPTETPRVPDTPTPTPTPAPGPPVDHGGQTLPPVTAPPSQPATPAATDPASSRWLLPSLAALGAMLLAGLGMWLLYRHHHPAGRALQGRSRMAR